MSRAGSIYNKLKTPIAVIGSRQAYQHLCHHVNVDASSNDLFHFVQTPEDALKRTYCRLIEVGNLEWNRANVRDYNVLVSLTKTMLRN